MDCLSQGRRNGEFQLTKTTRCLHSFMAGGAGLAHAFTVPTAGVLCIPETRKKNAENKRCDCHGQLLGPSNLVSYHRHGRRRHTSYHVAPNEDWSHQSFNQHLSLLQANPHRASHCNMVGCNINCPKAYVMSWHLWYVSRVVSWRFDRNAISWQLVYRDNWCVKDSW